MSTVRGGRVLSAERVGRTGQYTLIWCIDPETLAERALLVWTTGHDVLPTDEVWWHPGHSPAWIPFGEKQRRAFLPRCGLSFDPTTTRLTLPCPRKP
jgi:hypothetical protein